jgi:hypothetical protein
MLKYQTYRGMSSVSSQFFAVEMIFRITCQVNGVLRDGRLILQEQLPVDWHFRHVTSNADFRPSRVVDSAELSKLRALRAHVDQLALIFPPPTNTPRRINSLVYVRVDKNSLNLANLNFCDGPASSIPNV